MQSLLSALFAPEVLGLVLLAGVGLFVFLLVRPREQDPADPYWLAFMNPSPGDDHLRGAGESKPETQGTGDANRTEGGQAAGLSGIQAVESAAPVKWNEEERW